MKRRRNEGEEEAGGEGDPEEEEEEEEKLKEEEDYGARAPFPPFNWPRCCHVNEPLSARLLHSGTLIGS